MLVNNPYKIPHEPQAPRPMNRRASAYRALRIIASLFVVCLCLVAVAGAGLAWFIGQQTADDSLVSQKIEQEIGRLVGDDFAVKVSELSLEYDWSGEVHLTSPNIFIERKSDDARLATIENFSLVSQLTSAFEDELPFDNIKVGYVELNASVLGIVQGDFLLPQDFKEPLLIVGNTLRSVSQAIAGGNFQGVSVDSFIIRGKILGRRLETPVEIIDFKLSRKDDRDLALSGSIQSEITNARVNANYSSLDNGYGQLDFTGSGFRLEEWLEPSGSDVGFFAMDGPIDVKGALPFSNTGQPLDPNLQFTVSKGNLRLAKAAVTPIDYMNLNFQIFMDRNQIELNRSDVKFSDFRGTILGGLKPVNEDSGYHGPLLYDFIIDPGFYKPTRENEPVVPGAFQISGSFDRTIKLVNVKKVVFTTIDGTVAGSGAVNLDGETPAVFGQLSTNGVSVLALKQFWPFVVASPARKWVHDQVRDGRVVAGKASFDIPPGVLFRFAEGQKLKPENFMLEMELEDLSFFPFGELPAIENGKGTLRLEGMQIFGQLNSATAQDKNGSSVEITAASYLMPDFADKTRDAEVQLEMKGDIKTIASISDYRPLNVMQRLKVNADQFSGSGFADIAAKFPIKENIKYEEVQWNVLLDMKKGASSKPLQGRRFKNANILIDANPAGANVVGSATIDGVPAKIRFSEPIGKSGTVKKSREITAVLNQKQRAALGFDLSGIVNGPISVVINQTEKSEEHRIDFSKAEVLLPWIGWRKGKGIKANGGFDFKKKGNRLILSNFFLKGPGFHGNGLLEFDKGGLLRADLEKIKLNRFDDFHLKVRREKNVFNINANGLSFDTRGLINLLLNEGNFTKEQGKRSVNLVANFSNVLGFNDRSLSNAILLFKSTKGVTESFDLTAQSRLGVTRINAAKQASSTVFSIDSSDAGTAMAFTDIYTKMRGGTIQARLVQTGNGPYFGPVSVSNFEVVNEPRISRLVPDGAWELDEDTGQRIRKIKPQNNGEQIVPFKLAKANIVRGKGYMNLDSAIIRSRSMGFTMNGVLYDQNDNMNIKGLFMPSNDMNIALRKLPIIGEILSGGGANVLIGIRYQLSGSRKNPKLDINPASKVGRDQYQQVFDEERR